MNSLSFFCFTIHLKTMQLWKDNVYQDFFMLRLCDYNIVQFIVGNGMSQYY